MTIRTWVFGRVRVRRRRVRIRRRRSRVSASSRTLYVKHKEQARELVTRKLAEFNLFYKFDYNRIAIKNHSTRWGSCSKKGNLNFNFRLALIPEPLVDYVVAHELCHLGEFNHSKDFWHLLSQTVPNYVELRRQLHKVQL